MKRLIALLKKVRIYFIGLWRIRGFRQQTKLYNELAKLVNIQNKKCLYVSAVSGDSKERVKKIVEKFGHEQFDFMIFVYDGTRFDEDVFQRCRLIYEEGIKCYFWKKYLTPEFCSNYSYLFCWDDDIEILNFNWQSFLDVMRRNNLQLGQPALSEDSYISMQVTKRRPSVKVGRFVDFVEVMVPVFESCWCKFWEMLDIDLTKWGNGLDLVAKNYCGYSNMAVVDQEVVKHVRKVNNHPYKDKEIREFLIKHKPTKKAVFVSYGHLI